MSDKQKTPQCEGFYWAKTSDYKYYNAIVHVYGCSPFFKVIVWHTTDDKLSTEFSCISEWGDKIDRPD